MRSRKNESSRVAESPRAPAGSQLKRRDPLSSHEEDLLGSLEVLVVLVGEQLVDLLLPIVITGRDVPRGRDAPLLTAATAAAAGYNLVIL